MATDTPQPPIASQLDELVKMGLSYRDKPNVAFVVGNTWIHRVRNQISKIYGTDSNQVDYWCPSIETDRTERSVWKKVESRIDKVQSLLDLLKVPEERKNIFIGHGKSVEWIRLQNFLSINLQLKCDEFNIEPTAGLQTGTRIEQMLRSAQMAFLVMTPDDRHEDGSLHARANVIHEIGLFQARLGAMRAIVMLQEGCTKFSNLEGLTTINFPANDILARTEKVREVLCREGII